MSERRAAGFKPGNRAGGSSCFAGTPGRQATREKSSEWRAAASGRFPRLSCPILQGVERRTECEPSKRRLDNNAVSKSQPAVVSTMDSPTWFERTVSALMFVLPLSEGFYRLSLITVRFCKHHALEFLFWSHLQLRQVTLALSSRAVTEYTREDAVALETLMQMSQRIHTWFSDWFDQLLKLSVPLQAGRGDATLGSWVASTFTSPEALWHLCWLSCMSVVAVVVGFRFQMGSPLKPKTELKRGEGGLFRKPELITASYFCALLMRVSWAPLQGMSDLSLELYYLGATMLTLITTVAGLTQVHKLMFGNLAKVSRCLEGMVEQVTNVAQLHRSLLLLDWILCLFSKQVLETKCLRSLLLLVYWMTVTTLESEAQATKQMPKSSA